MVCDHKSPEPKANGQVGPQHGQCERSIPHHKGKMNSASNSFHPSAAHSPHSFKTLPLHAPQPTHLPAVAWKSEGVKERDKFDRTLKKVSYLAPGFVKCGIFPRNQDEWRDLRFDYICDQLALKDHDKKVLAARIEAMPSIPPQGRTIKSIFGPEGKEMEFAGSSVLGWSTMWSKHQHCHAARSTWPTIAELLMHGDNRADFGKLHRSLPLPRAQDENDIQSFEELRFIGMFPLDEVEPEFTCGPTYAEYTKRNAEDDNDESFQVEMEKLLDNALKQAIRGEVEKWLEIVLRERNDMDKHTILIMNEDEKKDRQGMTREKGEQGKTEEKNEQRKNEGKNQQGKGEKKNQHALNKGNGRRRHFCRHAQVHQFIQRKDQLLQPGMMMKGMGGMRPPIPSATINELPPYPYPGHEYGPRDMYGHGHGYRYGSGDPGRQTFKGWYAVPVAGTPTGPVPFMYGHQMSNGSYGYPQHDGSWKFTAPQLAAPPEPRQSQAWQGSGTNYQNDDVMPLGVQRDAK